jgi:hypothetical protein
MVGYSQNFCLTEQIPASLDGGVPHPDQHPQGGLHQDFLTSPGRFRLLGPISHVEKEGDNL